MKRFTISLIIVVCMVAQLSNAESIRNLSLVHGCLTKRMEKWLKIHPATVTTVNLLVVLNG